MLIPRNCASNARRLIMSWVSGNSVIRSSPLYCILRAKFAESLCDRSSAGVVAWACSTGTDCEFCSFVGRIGTPSSRPGAVVFLECGPPRRSKPAWVSKTGRRKLIPNLEHVTCREPTLTPINLAISCRLFPRSTRFLICWILSGVNFISLPRVESCVVYPSVCNICSSSQRIALVVLCLRRLRGLARDGRFLDWLPRV